MKETFLYDERTGFVFRCMFAGLDSKGHAQWVNITPGDKAVTLSEILRDDDTKHYRVLSPVGEAAESIVIAKVLFRELDRSVGDMRTGMEASINSMKKMGVVCDGKPLELMVYVTEDGEDDYSVSLDLCDSLDVEYRYLDDFKSIRALSECVETFVGTLEDVVGIPIQKKILMYDEKLKNKIKESFRGSNKYTHKYSEEID